jgi:hypothetical protein
MLTVGFKCAVSASSCPPAMIGQVVWPFTGVGTCVPLRQKSTVKSETVLEVGSEKGKSVTESEELAAISYELRSMWTAHGTGKAPVLCPTTWTLSFAAADWKVTSKVPCPVLLVAFSTPPSTTVPLELASKANDTRESPVTFFVFTTAPVPVSQKDAITDVIWAEVG